MADEKKISPKQVGIAVLKKFEELLLKASKEKNISITDLTKAEELKKDDAPPPTIPGGTTINSAIGNPFGKAEGEEPGIKGNHKLAKFVGRVEGKKAAKGMNQDSGNNTPAQPINSEMDKGETGHEKGVHLSPSKGHSEPSKNIQGMSNARLAGAKASLSPLPNSAEKDQHKQVLNEQKQMPKPNLPK